MDEKQILMDLGIDYTTLPKSTVRLLVKEDYQNLSSEAYQWANLPYNDKALGYEIETEHKRHQGILLRNLYLNKSNKSHLFVVNKDVRGPFFHNLTPALPYIWNSGIAILVEGPKDSRVLHSLSILNSVSYLGPIPRLSHLKVIRRYAHTIIWIPDNEDLSKQQEYSRNQVIVNCKLLNIQLRKIILQVKDPAELSYHLSLINGLKEKIEEVFKLSQGGYSNNGRLFVSL